MNILQEADKITGGARRESYGDPDKSLTVLANAWNNYLQMRGLIPPGLSLQKTDVAMLMVILKVYRNASKSQRDNLVDIAGYARVAEMADPKLYGEEPLDIPEFLRNPENLAAEKKAEKRHDR